MPVDLHILEDGWIEAEGLALQPRLRLRLLAEGSGRLRVRELRLDATSSPAPISAADLRDLPVSWIEALVNAHEVAPGDTLSSDTADSDFQLPAGGPTNGLTDDFLRDVARAYSAAVLRGERPNAAMAKQTGAPLKTVQRWTFIARQRGIMPRGSRGRWG